MKTKMNLRWRWLLGLSLVLCWLGGAGPNAVQAQESVRTAADKDKMVAMATMVAPTSATAAQGKVVASMPTADLPTVKVAQYRRGRKSALRDTVRFTAVWAADPDYDYPFEILLAGEGEGVIDWGDGTQTSCSAVKNEAETDYTYVYYGHRYTDEADDDEREITVYMTSSDLQIVGLTLYSYGSEEVTLQKSLDVHACPSLKYLSCGYSRVGTLDLTQNTALIELNCTYCRLTSLALPQSAALKILGCGGNQLTSLDVSDFPALRQLYCWGNRLTSLDVSGCPMLDTMQCQGNQLGWATLDALSQLGCSYLFIAPQNLSFEVGLNEAVDLSGYMTYKGQQTVCDFSAMPASAYTFNNSILKINRAGAFTVSMSNPAVKRNGESLPINCNVSVESGVSDTVRWVWQQNGGIDYVNLTIAGNAASITMDWGDGTIETEAVNANGFRQIRHIYATAGEYTVKIWGDNQWMLSGLELFGHSHVQSLDLSDCPYLESLVCSGNDLTALDLSACLSLRILNCANNKLTSLDLSKNLNLQQMNCAQNQLTSLSIEQNTAMRYLSCYNNQLTSLDVTQNTNLIMLDAANNQLTSLDVSANGKLQGLYCNGNQLTSLNVSQNTDLTHLYCWNNQLTSLNVRALTKLRYLSCSYNQLTALDLSQNTSLKLLYAGYNRLTSLDATNNPLLDTLECQSNQLTSLNVNPSTRFMVLNGSYNQLDWAALAALTALEGEDIMLSPQALPSLEVALNDAVDFSAYATYNGQQTVFAVTPEEGYTLNNGIVRIQNVGHYTVNMSNPGVTFKGAPVIISRSLTVWPAASDTLRWVVLDTEAMISYLNAMCDESFIVDWGDGQKETVTVSGQSYSGYNIKHSYGTKGEYAVTVYGLGHFMLLHLNLGSNVQSLDVRTCPFLEFLECEGHQLTELDLSKNTALTALNVSGNRLTSLNLTQNTGLTQLYCVANQLSSLDVSKNTALKYLYCNGNQLTSLDVSKNTALTSLDCSANQLTSLDVSKNMALTNLACASNRLTSLNLTQNAALEDLYCNGNQLSSLDVSENTALTSLSCFGNQLTSLDLSVCLSLEILQCGNNQLTSLDVSKNTALSYLACDGNLLSSLNMPQSTVLRYLSCENNRLGWADLDALSKIAVNNNFFISPQYLPLEVDVNEDILPAEYLTYKGQQTEFRFDDLLSSYYTLENGNVQFNSFGIYSFSITNPAVQPQNDIPIYINVLVSVWPAVSDTVRWVWQTDGGLAYVDLSMRYDEGFMIDWGDGTVEKSDGWYQLSHTYAAAGEYTVTAYGVNHWLLSALGFFNQPLVKSLDVSACPHLETLDCNGDGLTSLDLTKNTALKTLNIVSTPLTSLDLTKNTALKTLHCIDNHQLTSLDLSKNTALEALYCFGNQLTSLDLSKNTALTYLDCSNNQLASLDVSKNAALAYLDCSVNGLTSLDLSKNTALTALNCSNNQLTSLDVSENTALTSLHCSSNQLTSLDLSGNTALTSLHCADNQLMSLDVSGNTALTYLNCYNNQLTSLDLSQNTALETWDASGNVRRVDLDEDRTLDLSTLPGMDVSRVSNVEGAIWLNPQMIFRSENVTYDYATGLGTVTFRLKEAIVRDTVYMTWTAEAGKTKSLAVGPVGEEPYANVWIDFGDGNQDIVGILTEIENSAILSHTYKKSGTYNVKVSLESNARILTFNCDGPSRRTGNGVTSLDVSACSALETLSCNNNSLTTLDLSKNTSLTTLSYDYNPGLVLDFSQVPSLTSLSCNGNRLSALNVSQLPDLLVLWCADNQLTSLNLSQNTALRNLYCHDNRLSTLDVSSNRALKVLSCSNNQLTLLNLKQNTMLQILNCSDNQLTSLDVPKDMGINCYDNYRVVKLDASRRFDLSTLPEMDVARVRNVKGALKSGSILTFNTGVNKVTYEYATRVYTYDGDDEEHYTNYQTFSIGTLPLTPENPGTPLDTIFLTMSYFGGYAIMNVGVSVDENWKAGQKTFWVDWGDGTRLYSTSKEGENINVGLSSDFTNTRNVMIAAASSSVHLTKVSYGTIISSMKDVIWAVDVSACPSLEELGCFEGQMNSIDLSHNPALKTLNCSESLIQSLDLSHNVALETLNCTRTKLTSLDLSNHPALKKVSCNYGRMASLDVSGCSALTELQCSENDLTSLDMRGCSALSTLYCASNLLRSLDLTQNTALKTLDCGSNPLRSLDVSQNTALETLYCSNNRLTSLDVTKNTMLTYLECSNNQLTSLDVTKNTILTSLQCSDNQLTSLDVTKNTTLTSLSCANNLLTSLDLSKNYDLRGLYCAGNSRKVGVDENRGFDLSTLPGMDASRVSNVVGGFKAGSRLYFDEDADEVTYNYNTKHSGDYKTVEFRLIPAPVSYDTIYLTWTAEAGDVKALQVGIAEAENWTFEEFGVDWGDGTRLHAITQKDTSFTKTYTEAGTYAVKVWTASPLRFGTFGCSGNGITSLDVSACTELTSLTCDNNQLKDLDLSGNTKLEALYCQNNQLTFNTISAFPIYDRDDLIPGRLSPQCDFYYTITLEEGFPLPERMEVKNQPTAIVVIGDGGFLSENNGYTIRDGRMYFDKAGTYQLEVSNMWVACSYDDEEGSWWGIYYENSFVTVKGEDEPGPIDPIDPEKYDLVVWTWAEGGDDAMETNVSFAGTPGGTFVIDWGDGEKETVECTGELVEYAHTYGVANPVGPMDTLARSGKKGLMEWRLYAATPESRILALQKISAVGLANETLDVSACPELTYLGWVGCEGCGGGLTALDVSRNVKLEKLYCYDNRLTSLDVTRNTALTLLSCHRNQLTALDLTKNTALTILSAADNRFTSLDVTKNVALFRLSCSGNQLTQLDVTKNTALTELYCYDNRLTELDLTKNTTLQALFCGGNRLTSLDVTQCVALTSLNCFDNQLTSLDVSRNTALTILSAADNRFTSLDVTQNLMLETLYCSGNRLTSLDVSQNTALTWLSCDKNQLTSLDVSDCMALEVLFCNNNRLTSLDVTRNTKLMTVQCDSNYLPLSVLASIKAEEAACLSPQLIAHDMQPGQVLDLRSEMRVGTTQTVFTMTKDGKPVDTSAYTMSADDVYGQLRFKSTGRYRLSLSNAEVVENYVLSPSGVGIIPNETQKPVYVYYDITVDQPIVQGSGAGWMWLASAGAEKQITFEGSEKGFRIDWGDETASDVESGLATHRYAEGGIYTVKIESLSNDGRLTSLDVSNGNVAMIWFEDASKLTSLNCADNQLTSVDLSALSNLQNYNCARNQFSSLDLRSLAQLQTVDFSGNSLTGVSLPTHSNLKSVKGTDNRIKLSTLYGLLSQRVEKASYGFDPQGDSIYVTAGDVLDLSAEMNIGGNMTTFIVSDAEGRPVQASDYAETNGSFRFTAAGRRYKLTLMNMSVMEYQDGNPRKPVTFVLNVIVPGVGNEELTGSDACVYVRNRTICLSEDLGEMRVYTTLGRCIYQGNGMEAEVPCAGLYVVQAGGHTWKVVVR